jgi:hypothetical protein
MQTASTSEILQWTHCLKLHRGDKLAKWDSLTARRALASIGAARVGRARTTGRPWIWRLSGSAPVEPALETKEK